MNSVIVVEGIHDEMRIKSLFPKANVVITNGREISDDTLKLIKTLSLSNEIIIFTDPDFPGEKIREKINLIVPNAKHAFLRKKDAISTNKRKIGIEHASDEALLASLANVYEYKENEGRLTNKDLFEIKLWGVPNSAILREKLAIKLNIGRPNGKTLLKRLNMLQISKEELVKLCQELEM